MSKSAVDFQQHLPGYTVYLVNYRGYGGSSGSPSQDKLFSDALKIYDQMIKRHHSIAVIGRSLGSGVATFLASQRSIDHLILITPFDSVLAIAEQRYPIYPVSLMLQDKYLSIEYAPNIQAPTLLLVAEHDDIVPRHHSRNLAQAFSDELLQWTVINNSNHNNLSHLKTYWNSLAGFLATKDHSSPSTNAQGVDKSRQTRQFD